MTFYVYQLGLECNKFYVGQTEDLDKRINEHFAGNGAKWTKRFMPKYRHHHETFNDYIESINRENVLTCTLFLEHGINNVRGGDFVEERDYTKEDIYNLVGDISNILNMSYSEVKIKLNI